MFSLFDNNKVFLIGEIGVNHNGKIENAFKLIDVAKDAGMDAVKFQTSIPHKSKIKSAPFAQYQKDNTEYKSSYEMSLKLTLSDEEHYNLKKYCDEKDIIFLSTGFISESVDLLEKVGVPAFKIPSGEITNYPLVRHIAEKNKPIILSTGMADLFEIDRCYNYIREINNQSVAILHCVSLYPTEFDLLNLNFITTLRSIYGDIIGFSDHTLGIEASVAAAALGARVIEKHITLGKNMEGPDHKASLEPHELIQLVSCIRNVEKGLGKRYKEVSIKEKEMRTIARKSIVSNADIKKGERFNRRNTGIKKPGAGISPEYYDIIIGRKATKDIVGDILLTWDMVGSIDEG